MNKYFLILLIALFSINIYSLPSYIEKDGHIFFTTYYYPIVFKMDKDTIEGDFDASFYKKIVKEANLKRKIVKFQSRDIYLDLFIGAFSKISLDKFRVVENFEKSGFSEETLIMVKNKFIRQYIDKFKEGYLSASQYFSGSNDQTLLRKSYYQPFLIPMSPEEVSSKLGESTGKNFFDPVFLRYTTLEPENQEFEQFINTYAYCLGEISYIKTYYVK